MSELDAFGGSPAKVSTLDGEHFAHLEPLHFNWRFKLYRIPVGSTTDGASTPPIIWNILGILELPPFGLYWRPADAHDSAYRATLEVMNEAGEWVKANLEKAHADEMLNELMMSCGVPELTRLLIYEGVRLGGGKAFAEDRSAAKKTITESVITRHGVHPSIVAEFWGAIEAGARCLASA